MGRSRDFELYLTSLTPAERAKILAAEREYRDGSAKRVYSLERVFDEQMRGHEVTPAGPRAIEE